MVPNLEKQYHETISFEQNIKKLKQQIDNKANKLVYVYKEMQRTTISYVTFSVTDYVTKVTLR